jgi:general secretion pathway protein J
MYLPRPALAHKHHQGFTLIELLVALAIMALMAMMAWSALGGMQDASMQSRQRTDALLTLDAGLAQWTADLDNLQELPHITALDWNGRALRISRRHSSDPAQGLLVVAWTRSTRSVGNGGETDHWVRWQSGPLRSRQEWAAAWRNAATWAQSNGTKNPSPSAESQESQEVAIAPLQQWQIYYFRGGAWSNALSSAGTLEAPQQGAGGDPNASVPDGVRLVLTIASPHPLAGVLTRDWARATHTGAAP